MLVSCLVFIFLSAWSATGTVWAMAETKCTSQLTTCSLILSTLSLTTSILISLTCVYWKLISSPGEEGRGRPVRRSLARDHTIFMLETI